MLLLKSFRKNIKGFADILKYGALIEPSVILCKDGSFLTMYEFRGKDTASSTENELNYIALQMNNALKTFGDGWALHVDAVRTASTYYPDNNHFPEDGVGRLIDEERRAFFKDATCYQTRQYLTITYLPGYAADKMAAKASGQKMQDEIERGLKAFKLGLAAFEDIAISAIRLRRLGEYQSGSDTCHEMLEIIHYLITGIKQGITLPPCPMYLDAILPSQDVEGGAHPKVGENHIAVISIDGFPQASWPAMLKILDQLPFEYRFHTRWLALSKESAAKEIKMLQKGWNQKVYSAIAQLFNSQRAKPNTDALRMVDDAQSAADALMSDQVSFGYLTSSIVILDKSLDLLEEAARLVRKSVQGLNFTCRIETLNTMDAWIGSHPGNTYANIRRPLLNSMNLAHLLPLASTWHGSIHNPCPLYPPKSPCLAVVVTDGNTPFYFSPHVVDVGHMLICGTTGTGKSTLLNFLAGQFPRYPEAKIFCFDKSRSMKILCDAEGGRHFDLGVNRQISFAPLADIDREPRRAWALEWLEDLINMQDPAHQVSARQRNVIAESLLELSLQPAEFRTLTQMHILFSAKDEFLADSIRNYTLKGTEGHLLDASIGSVELSRFTVFEIEELMNRGDRTLVPTLQYLFSVIERSLTGAPSLLILDEAWIMFGHPVFRAKIREWLKMLRKANCSLVLATQQLTDAVNSGIFDILIDSCQTKIWLPNREAKDNEMLREIYAKAGLNSREIEIISEATPKRDYYVKSPEGSRLVNLNLQEKALAFCAHNSKEALAEVDRLQAAYPDTWRELWLERCKSREQAA